MNISPDRIKRGLYWQKAWKLVEGCTKVSPGCDNCWSEEQDKRRVNHPNEDIRLRARDVVMTCGVNGSISDGTATGWQEVTGYDGRIILREDNLDLPLKTRKPTVFAIWNDLFHEDVTDEFRDRAYAVMARCPQHVFLVLTKRAARMAEYMNALEVKKYADFHGDPIIPHDTAFPLKNVWHGVTAENQEQADSRIPYLLQVPGNRFVSIEPMLGAVDLCNIDPLPNIDHSDVYMSLDVLCGHMKGPDDLSEDFKIHAVLLGGESGKNARPMHPDWVRSVRDQCESAGVPFFFKQWGEWLPDNQNPQITVESGPTQAIRVGKRKAGRTLDGRIHDDLP